MSTEEIQAVLEGNVSKMNMVEGFDVVIVCTNNEKQASYWQQRLEAAKGTAVSPDAVILAVNEDWEGGAGNALGTLYAYQKAAALAMESDLDLSAQLAAGEISVGLYHTAGKGTRLSPLPGSENNNKPGVKLAVSVDMDGTPASITILEGVVKQTGVYAKSRKGRLSVFWGDQVFIPSVGVEYESAFHADILCTLGPMLDEEQWIEKGMDKYGLIAVNSEEQAAQVEKVSHEVATRLLASLGTIESVGASLGSFSMSFLLLETFLEEFSEELSAKEGKLDSDPHLWMPLTLEESAYIEIMESKGTDPEVSAAHHARMQECLAKFNAKEGASDMGLFGAVNVGDEACWWDYGLLKLYRQNNRLLTADTAGAELLRKFLGISERVSGSTLGEEVSIDEASVVTACEVGAGSIVDSVLSNVKCKYVEAEGCILVNVTAKRITAPKGSIIYNIMDDSSTGVCVTEGGVMVGVHGEDGSQMPVWSNADSICGGKAWKKKVAGNSMSFEEIYGENHTTDVFAVEGMRAETAELMWAEIKG
ncbi:unnamed protein product [Choristocarpus tenellus]